MKKLTIAACAAAMSSLFLAQMTAPADARSRHKRMTTKSMSTSTTGGLNSSSSAAAGNSSSPAQPGARGSAGGSNSN